jgi:hypothetical protein
MSNTLVKLNHRQAQLIVYADHRCYFWKVETPDEKENINSIGLLGFAFNNLESTLTSANTYFESLVKRLYNENYVPG